MQNLFNYRDDRLTTDSSKYQWTLVYKMHKVHLKTVKTEIKYFFFEWKLINFFPFVLWLHLLLGAVLSVLSSKSWKGERESEKKTAFILTEMYFQIKKNRTHITQSAYKQEAVFFFTLVDFVFNFYSLLGPCCLCIHSSRFGCGQREKNFCAKRNSQLDIFGLRNVCVYVLFVLRIQMELDIFGQHQPNNKVKYRPQKKIHRSSWLAFCIWFLDEVSTSYTPWLRCAYKSILNWNEYFRECLWVIFSRFLYGEDLVSCAVVFFIFIPRNMKYRRQNPQQWLCEDRVKSHNNFLRGTARQGKVKSRNVRL